MPKIPYSKSGTYNTYTRQSAFYTASNGTSGSSHNNGCPVLAQVKSPTTPGVIQKVGKTDTYWRQPTTYSRRCHKWTYLAGTRQEVKNGVTYNWTGVRVIRNPAQDNPPWVSWNFGILNHSGRDQVKVQAMNKLHSVSAELGTSMAEAKKTAHSLADDTHQLLLLLRKAKKSPWALPSHLRAFARAGNNPRELWLKWRYGYRPLIKDLYDQAELIKNGLQSEPPIIRGSSRVVTKYSGKYQNGEYTTSITDRCTIWGLISDELARGVGRVGLNDPLSVGWEVVPFSFVVDWFVPIGKLIRALQAPAGVSFLAGYASQTRAGKISMPEWCGSSEQEYSIFLRERFTTWPKVYAYAVSDPFGLGSNKPNLSRIIDSLALLGGRR